MTLKPVIAMRVVGLELRTKADRIVIFNPSPEMEVAFGILESDYQYLFAIGQYPKDGEQFCELKWVGGKSLEYLHPDNAEKQVILAKESLAKMLEHKADEPDLLTLVGHENEQERLRLQRVVELTRAKLQLARRERARVQAIQQRPLKGRLAKLLQKRFRVLYEKQDVTAELLDAESKLAAFVPKTAQEYLQEAVERARQNLKEREERLEASKRDYPAKVRELVLKRREVLRFLRQVVALNQTQEAILQSDV